jgi:VCBS repeat-containing protein
VTEGAAAGTLVGVTVLSSDPNGGAVTYALTTNPGGFFQIGSNGVVSVSTAGASGIDFESSGGSYTIGVQASDPSGALSSVSNFTINVSDVAPTASGFNGIDPTVTEALQGGTAVTLLTGAPIVGDVNSTTLAGATVQISSGFQSGDVLAANTSGTSITASGGLNGTLTLSGVDTFAHYEQVLASITYQDSGSDTTTVGHPTRTVTWTVSDGTLSSIPVMTQVTIDRPVHTVADTNRAIAAANAPGVSGNVLNNDSDPDGDSLVVNAIEPGTGNNLITVPTGTAGITVSGSYGDLLIHRGGGYTYSPGVTVGEQTAISNAPTGSHPIDVFTYRAGDTHNGATTTTLAVTLDRAPITPVHSVNVRAGGSIAGSGGLFGTGALGGDSDLDGDTLGITSATGVSTVAVPSGLTPVSVAGSYGTLQIATDGSYTYTANPTNNVANAHAIDTFTLNVADAGPASSSETLSFNINRAPSVTISPTLAVFTAGGPAVRLLAGSGINDPDADLISGSSILVSAGAFTGDGDQFRYGSTVLSASPTAVTIGSDNFSISSTGESVTIAGSGTGTEYQTLLDNILYQSTASDPTNAGANAARTLSFTVTDQNGAQSTAQTESLNVAGSLFGSYTFDPTSAGGLIYTLYDAFLGRTPDGMGFEGWVADLQNGDSLSNITLPGFLDSNEFTHDFGPLSQLTDDQFLNDLYETGLHRAPDPQGQQHYEALLANGTSREDVALDIALSPEHEQDLQAAFSAGVFVPSLTDTNIARLYYGLLDRAPDGPGLSGWEQAAANGVPLDTIAQDFINSSEYQTLHGPQTDQQFVDSLYQAALGRAPDAPGEQQYDTMLANGVPRGDVAMFITGSPEAQLHLQPQIEYGFKLA